jgi:acyl-CoA dehydrogenase
MPDATFLKWPFFEPHHGELARKLDEWCTQTLKGVDHGDVDARCRELVRALAEGGWLRYVVPAKHGGVFPNIDVRSLCIIRETLARHDGLADFSFAMQGLGSGAITLFGTDEQKQRYLPDVVAGRKIAAFALTELASGSDVANMETSARWHEGEYVIDGGKTFISNGGIAHYYVLFARTHEAPGAKGISAFIVDAGTSGLDDSERLEAIAPHPLATLRLRHCRVDERQLIGTRGGGFAQAMATLDVFRPTVGAAALGFARRALDEGTERALSRTLFGSVLASNPVTQSKLAEMALDVDASALLVYRAAWTCDTQGGRNSREAAMAKLHATESAQLVVDKAVQLFGGLGVIRGIPVESLYREVRALRIYEGASEVQKMIIARQHLASYARMS